MFRNYILFPSFSENENIVHVHDNKNVTSSSKIEKHLRECIKNKVPTNELASKIKPQLVHFFHFFIFMKY
jgi:hypothetical protein